MATGAASGVRVHVRLCMGMPVQTCLPGTSTGGRPQAPSGPGRPPTPTTRPTGQLLPLFVFFHLPTANSQR